MNLNFDLYKERSIQFIEIWQIADWRMKIYSILYKEQKVSPSLLDKVKELTKERLEISAKNTKHYNSGFVGIHAGKTANFIFVDWWANENELHHHVYVSSKQDPTNLQYKTPTGLTACVWDLELINFERNAWVRTALKTENPRLTEYLNQRCNGNK